MSVWTGYGTRNEFITDVENKLDDLFTREGEEVCEVFMVNGGERVLIKTNKSLYILDPSTISMKEVKVDLGVNIGIQ